MYVTGRIWLSYLYFCLSAAHTGGVACAQEGGGLRSCTDSYTHENILCAQCSARFPLTSFREIVIYCPKNHQPPAIDECHSKKLLSHNECKGTGFGTHSFIDWRAVSLVVIIRSGIMRFHLEWADATYAFRLVLKCFLID